MVGKSRTPPGAQGCGHPQAKDRLGAVFCLGVGGGMLTYPSPQTSAGGSWRRSQGRPAGHSPLPGLRCRASCGAP